MSKKWIVIGAYWNYTLPVLYTRAESIPHLFSICPSRSIQNVFHNRGILVRNDTTFCLRSHIPVWIKFLACIQMKILVPSTIFIPDRLQKELILFCIQKMVLFLHHNFRPITTHQKLMPVNCRTGCPHAIIILRIILHLHQTLSATARTTIHIRIAYRTVV